jgi:hypothetical protein
MLRSLLYVLVLVLSFSVPVAADRQLIDEAPAASPVTRIQQPTSIDFDIDGEGDDFEGGNTPAPVFPSTQPPVSSPDNLTQDPLAGQPTSEPNTTSGTRAPDEDEGSSAPVAEESSPVPSVAPVIDQPSETPGNTTTKANSTEYGSATTPAPVTNGTQTTPPRSGSPVPHGSTTPSPTPAGTPTTDYTSYTDEPTYNDNDEPGDDEDSDWDYGRPETEPPKPYVEKDDDPLKNEEAGTQWNENPQETPEQMMHDRNVLIAVAVVAGVGVVLAVCTAHQVMNNPDGCCAR